MRFVASGRDTVRRSAEGRNSDSFAKGPEVLRCV